MQVSVGKEIDMRVAWLWFVGLAACQPTPPAVVDVPLRAGVAVARQQAICLDFPDPALVDGTKLKVLVPGGANAAAEVAGPASDACKPLEKTWGHYLLRLTAGELPPNQPAIALAAAAPKVQPKSCASSEGLHLSLWDGKPLESKRLWHYYYPLGYDVEADCSPQETKTE